MTRTLLFPEVIVDDSLRQEVSIDLVATRLEVADPVHHNHARGGALPVDQTTVNSRIVVRRVLAVGVVRREDAGVAGRVVDGPGVLGSIVRRPVHKVAHRLDLYLRLLDVVVILHSKHARRHFARDSGVGGAFLGETPS